jgi:hypothetical protein
MQAQGVSNFATSFMGWSMFSPQAQRSVNANGTAQFGGYEVSQQFGLQSLGFESGYQRQLAQGNMSNAMSIGNYGSGWNAPQPVTSYVNMGTAETTKTLPQKQGGKAGELAEGWRAVTTNEGGSWDVAPTGIKGDITMHEDLVNLTKEMRVLDEAMIQANRESQAQSIGFARQRAQLQYQQGMENWDMSHRIFQAQTAYSRQEMAIQQPQMLQQQQWVREDQAYQQQTAGLNFGWQQEDLRRNIRFATGRQRFDLKRQQERGQIMYGMEEGQRSRERERTETKNDWENQAFERQKAHFEEMTKLQEEQFQLQKQHLEENFAQTMAQLAAQEAQMQKTWALEDARRKKEQEWQDKQNGQQKAELENRLKLAQFQAGAFAAEMEDRANLAKAQGAYNMWQAMFYLPGGPLHEATKSFFQFFGEEMKAVADWIKADMPASGIQHASMAGGNATMPEFPDMGAFISAFLKLVSEAPTLTNPPSGGGDQGTAPGPGSGAVGAQDAASPSAQVRGPSLAAQATGSVTNAPAAQNSFNITIKLGDKDVTDLVAVQVVGNQKFMRGLDALARQQRNWGIQ